MELSKLKALKKVSGSLNYEDWLILTDEDADEKVYNEIKEALWTFTSDFIAEQTDIDSKVFRQLSELCENGNEAILKIVESTCGLDDFVKKAVKSCGRGHFLATYDGNEIEEKNYFLYRQN